jgi:hypothetical protein
MSQVLCQGIIDYIQNRCNSHEDLSATAKEIVATHKGGLLTDKERDLIFAAGKVRRAELNKQKPEHGES